MNIKQLELISILAAIVTIVSCQSRPESTLSLAIYTDSVVSDVSNHPVGLNVNFLMDGDRFKDAETSTTDAIRQIGSKYLRYPGGEKSDFYYFSLPPYTASSTTLNRSAGVDNYPGAITVDGELVYDPLDFDEFIAMCHEVGAEPVLVVAADRYLDTPQGNEFVPNRQEMLRNAVEWVRYANVKKNYNVRYWMIGNESWNKNNANSTADIYAQDVIDFSKAMKAVDPSILIIPNGESDDFFRSVITKAGDYIDRLCVSNYGVYDFFKGYDSYKDTTRCLIYPALTALNAMNKYATTEQLKKWKLIVAEYGTIDWFRHWQNNNDMGHAIVNFDMTGQLLLQPQIDFSCFWNTRWVENEKMPQVDHDAISPNGEINPTGFALKIWNDYMGDQMVKSESNGHLISYAGISSDQNKLSVFLINKGELPSTVELNIASHEDVQLMEAWEYFGKDDEDIRPIWQSCQDAVGKVIPVKPYSITVVLYKMPSAEI